MILITGARFAAQFKAAEDLATSSGPERNYWADPRSPSPTGPTTTRQPSAIESEAQTQASGRGRCAAQRGQHAGVRLLGAASSP
jgi:hypothetical protein